MKKIAAYIRVSTAGQKRETESWISGNCADREVFCLLQRLHVDCEGLLALRAVVVAGGHLGLINLHPFPAMWADDAGSLTLGWLVGGWKKWCLSPKQRVEFFRRRLQLSLASIEVVFKLLLIAS